MLEIPKSRASYCGSWAKGSVQAQAIGITRPGADRVVADKTQTYCPRLERLVPWFLRNQSCLDTYEILNFALPAALRSTILHARRPKSNLDRGKSILRSRRI